MDALKNKRSICIFLIITFALSSICYYICIKYGKPAAGMVQVLMWCPGIAAFSVRRIYFPKQKILGWNGCKQKYIIYSGIIPIIYLGLSYGGYLIVNQNTFTGKLQTNSVLMILAAIPGSFLGAIGEEIGWRGFLLPKMTEVWNIKKAIIVSGLIWAVWHFPLLITGLYQPGTVMWYKLPMFTIEILAMATIMSYMRMVSNSVWPAIVLHASHNYFNGVIFGPLARADMKSYYVGETGFVTAILMIMIACMVKRKFSKELVN